MAGQNDIRIFGENASAGNGDVLADQAAYIASATRLAGNQPGIAKREEVNHALRQMSRFIAGLAKSISDQEQNVADDGNTANLATAFNAAILSLVAANLFGYKSAVAAGPLTLTADYQDFVPLAIIKKFGASSVLVAIGKCSTGQSSGQGLNTDTATIALDDAPVAGSEAEGTTYYSGDRTTLTALAVMTGVALGAHNVDLQVKGGTFARMGSLLVVEINNPFDL